MWRFISMFENEIVNALAKNRSFQRFVVGTEQTLKESGQRLKENGEPFVEQVSQDVARVSRRSVERIQQWKRIIEDDLANDIAEQQRRNGR
jgi:hypothetical protein